MFIFVLSYSSRLSHFFFFFNDTATTEIYTLSLHDALPISHDQAAPGRPDRLHDRPAAIPAGVPAGARDVHGPRVGDAEDRKHTSELQSRQYLVCRLLLEKKKK